MTADSSCSKDSAFNDGTTLTDDDSTGGGGSKKAEVGLLSGVENDRCDNPRGRGFGDCDGGGGDGMVHNRTLVTTDTQNANVFQTTNQISD